MNGDLGMKGFVTSSNPRSQTSSFQWDKYDYISQEMDNALINSCSWLPGKLLDSLYYFMDLVTFFMFFYNIMHCWKVIGAKMLIFILDFTEPDHWSWGSNPDSQQYLVKIRLHINSLKHLLKKKKKNGSLLV